jgi:glycosyltransferase involved in cell wall biosynthesis
MDILSWRDQWGQLLAGASSIRVFSPSSRVLLRRVWPEFDSKVVLTPHNTAHIPRSDLSPAPESPLHIGVVGRIAAHKGATQVARLARHIAETGASARITVFGTLEEPAPASVVSQTGTYSAEALPALCAEQGVNVFWLPSIWPETFSFVVHEMKAMGLPVLAYDVGAQSDTLVDEDRHRVVSLDASPEDILATLTEMRSAS